MPRGSLGTLASLAEEGELEDLEAGVEHVPLAGKRGKQGCQRLFGPSQNLYMNHLAVTLWQMVQCNKWAANGNYIILSR